MRKIKKDSIKKLADWLDDKIPAGILEGVDGFAINLILNAVNNKWGDNIPDNLTDDIELLIDNLVSENWEELEMTVADVMAELINTPLIDGTEEEKAVYKLVVSSISDLIQNWIAKK